MGSYPYFYFTEYQEDSNAALQALRQREFEAGRYEGAMETWRDVEFPPDKNSPAPGAQHSSIEEAMEDSDGCGTGSILDIQRVSPQPEFLASSPLPGDFLIRLVGTEKPTHGLVNRIVCQEDIRDEDTNVDENVWDEIADEMGSGGSFYFVVYENDQPSELFFMGYSID
ncbi:MAG: hypothetical protein F6K16_39690 [Symploca sp. SIO2B6]|nr:hypothetical protein [Symploca sp. SIO2B6]